ncbi:hypothetical protein EW053_20525 [Streptomyces sp. IB2014 016-6]|nr:hypothetical protein EW053_20525 [Streptomyces sp. IB2014 016-6]
MHREGPHPGIRPERVRLDRERRVGRLGLAVRLPLEVAALELHGAPAHRRELVPVGGGRDDSRAAALDRRPEPVHKREVTEAIGGELSFPAGADARIWARHDPGVADHQVDGAVDRRCAGTTTRAPAPASARVFSKPRPG